MKITITDHFGGSGRANAPACVRVYLCVPHVKYLSQESFNHCARTHTPSHTHTHPSDCSTWTNKVVGKMFLFRLWMYIRILWMHGYGCGVHCQIKSNQIYLPTQNMKEKNRQKNRSKAK